MRKKNKLPLKEATKKLSDLMSDLMKDMTPRKQKECTEVAYKGLVARLKGKRSTSRAIPSRSSQPSLTPSSRLAARSRS